MNESILPAELDRLIRSGAEVKVFDVRREADLVEVDYPIPGSVWRDPERVGDWNCELEGDVEVIVYCVHGHHVSRSVRDELRRRGVEARIVEGGIEAWCGYAKSLRTGSGNRPGAATHEL